MSSLVMAQSSWNSHEPSFRFDILCLVMSLLIHFPLFFMKFNTQKKSEVSEKKERLVSVDIIDPEAPKPVVPPPPPVVEKQSVMERIKAMVKKEPPPPPPPPKAVEPPKELIDAPKAIQLQPKQNLAETLAPKIQSKAGFITDAAPKMIEDKKIALNSAPVGIAPLSAKKFGVDDNRDSVLKSKGNFAVSTKDSLKSIGGEGPGLIGAGNVPTIAIKTASKGSVENFSAPITQKSDKGRIGNVAAPAMGEGPKLGLRDQIIARDAAPSQINTGGSRMGVPGGVSGGTGTKVDAGKFQGGVIGGVQGGTGSKLGGSVASAVAPKIAEVSPRKKQQSAFVITGPLKDRKIEKQVVPEYPEWAQAQGIESAVVIEFTVDASGFVKSIMRVRRTSGYPKLDDEAMKALRLWKFIALQDAENREEVGQITFNFSLH
ncbi:MAG: energy transducer TonB [Elusimicrobiota bacterium]